LSVDNNLHVFVSLYLCGYNRLSYFDHGKYDNMNIY